MKVFIESALSRDPQGEVKIPRCIGPFDNARAASAWLEEQGSLYGGCVFVPLWDPESIA